MGTKFTLRPKTGLFLCLFLLIGNAMTAADTIPPVINLNTPDTVELQVLSTYAEVDPSISDNQSDLANITVKKTFGFNGAINTIIRGWYSITYEATDSNGNKSSKTRYVKVDDFIPPVIYLKTADTVYHPIATAYFSVQPDHSDNYYSKNQVSLVKLSGNVNIYIKGTYYEVFEAVDGSGNKATKTRVIIIGDGQSSIADLKNYAIRLNPNPANGNFKISLPAGLSKVGIKICSFEGKMLYEDMGLSNGAIIETGSLETGVYTVLLDYGNMTTAVRLLVQH
jgi:hypothetical protein